MEGVTELVRRLSGFCSLDIMTIKPVGESGSGIPREKIISEESMMISRVIPKNSFLVVLDEKGKEFSSIEFAKFLEERADRGDKMVLVIGGAFGLSENLKKSANLLMSMSKMTFTHQMVRLFLLEQIYRGFCITSGKEYHY